MCFTFHSWPLALFPVHPPVCWHYLWYIPLVTPACWHCFWDAPLPNSAPMSLCSQALAFLVCSVDNSAPLNHCCWALLLLVCSICQTQFIQCSYNWPQLLLICSFLSSPTSSSVSPLAPWPPCYCGTSALSNAYTWWYLVNNSRPLDSAPW